MFGTKVVEKIKLVEVPVGTRLQGGEEIKDSVASLQAHPGFQYLLAKLAIQHAYLRNKLDYERHKDMEDIAFLQSGIYWSRWLKQEVDSIVYKKPVTPVDAEQAELDAFKVIDAQIERVGMDD